VSDLKITEVEVQKLNLKPDDVLVVTWHFDDEYHAQDGIQMIQKTFNEHFPENDVIVFGMCDGMKIELTTVKKEKSI
jgi:hypothetical protein